MDKKIKEKRSLSGIFFRFKNPETGEMENRCFEESPLLAFRVSLPLLTFRVQSPLLAFCVHLPEEDQDKFLDNRDIDWVKNLAKKLSESLRNVGDIFEITKGEENEK